MTHWAPGARAEQNHQCSLSSGGGDAQRMCGSVAAGSRLQPLGMREPALYKLPDVINGLLCLTERSVPEESRGALEMPEDEP